ncbi:beta-ketoacyl-ACP synthase III [Pediococcus pentosaceus]|uniref:beta-ketoacyl-ACP synthase III n=1 Tax=Pediococcus pentosaceus TaxID=1255 RepID=UPI0018A17504|nr:beta-ketoacyl-ACP synthase III [Pediococcus pentosaceus]MBF7124378.1 ketoacyl-ACP synthase III [Pediococcus pentosaceus]MCR1861600.1 ketoacyl-ACP synthase III [Pediococcus pentosaceus]
MSLKILSTAHYVPERVVDNDELSKIMDTNDEWIQSHTGIQTRHYAMGEENTSSLAVEVGQKLLNESGLTADQIDVIILSTITPDALTPATATIVQAKLGAKNAIAFDISAACAGFVFGLSTAEKFMRSGRYRNAMVISAETNSKMMDFKDRTSAVFFGDGAGGVIISADAHNTEDFFIDEELAILAEKNEYIHSGRIPALTAVKANNFPTIDAFFQSGRDVFSFATGVVPPQMVEILNRNDLHDKVDYVICHQANLRIIEKISETINIPMEKFVTNVEQYGNTSSAGIPMALAQLQEKDPNPKTVLMTGFGAGLDYGSMLIRI